MHYVLEFTKEHTIEELDKILELLNQKLVDLEVQLSDFDIIDWKEETFRKERKDYLEGFLRLTGKKKSTELNIDKIGETIKSALLENKFDLKELTIDIGLEESKRFFN